MNANEPNTGLHLPDLTIRGFRGIKDLTIPKLGRVTLLAGENGVGKSTVLDAVRLYAAQGHYRVIRRILSSNDEVVSIQDEDEDPPVSIPNCQALFFGRNPDMDSCVLVSTGKDGPALRIRPGLGLFRQRWPSYQDYPEDETRLIEVSFPGIRGIVRKRFPSTSGKASRGRNMLYRTSPLVYRENDLGEERHPEVPCLALGPNVPSKAEIIRLWHGSALTPAETDALGALQLVYGNTIEQVAALRDADTPFLRSKERLLVKVEGQTELIPLQSLGDGAVRMYTVALALARTQGGVMLLDEVENGIHYRRQPDFWKMVIRTAQENNVQVVATTHSWDCIVGFDRALRELENVDGILYRIDRYEDGVEAVDYNPADIRVIVQQGIESR